MSEINVSPFHEIVPPCSACFTSWWKPFDQIKSTFYEAQYADEIRSRFLYLHVLGPLRWLKRGVKGKKVGLFYTRIKEDRVEVKQDSEQTKFLMESEALKYACMLKGEIIDHRFKKCGVKQTSNPLSKWWRKEFRLQKKTSKKAK